MSVIIKFWRAGFAVLAAVVFVVHGAPVQAQQADKAWWEGHPDYNEDEWYDPTDWFDANNYEFDREAYEQVQGGRANESRDRSSNAGWRVSDDDGGLAYYRDTDDDGVYEQSHRYYDFNNDGDYDAYMALFDRDNDGDYEEMDFVSFGPVDWQDRARVQHEASDDSRRHQLTGRIRNLDQIDVRGRQHLVAAIETEAGDRRLVDLGPAAAVRDLDLRRGDQIHVRGAAAAMSGRFVVILADEIRAHGRTQAINRVSHQARGTLVSLRYANARGVQHAMGVVESDDGRRTWIDFGPAKKLTELEFRPGEYLTATGPMVKVDGQRVLMAQTVRHRNTTATIDRDLRDRIARRDGGDQRRRR